MFLPTRLISAAASAKVPMTLPAHIFCEYDGYHHHPVEEGTCAPGAAPASRGGKKASKRSRGDGGGAAAAGAQSDQCLRALRLFSTLGVALLLLYKGHICGPQAPPICPRGVPY